MSIETINAGDTIAQLRTKLINNFDYLAALLNGNLDGTNFQYLGGSGHGNLSYIYEPLHVDQSIYRPDGDTLEDALDDAYERVTGIRETGEMLPVFLDSKTDSTYYEGGAGFSQVVFPSTEITIPANVATYGIMVLVKWSCLSLFGDTIELALRLNEIDLVGARWVLRKRGHMVTGLIPAPLVYPYPAGTECNLHATYLVADGWDKAVENKIRIGTLAGSYFKSLGCTLTIFALR